MNRTRLLLLSTLTGLAAAPLVRASPARQEERQDEKARPDIYDAQADAKATIDAALQRAARKNKRVLVQWGANWCGWCHLLHDLFEKDPAVAKELLYEYEVVLVDIGRWDKHLDLAEKYGADLEASGVPYLTVLHAAGKVLANQETGSLEKEGEKPAHDPAKVQAFLDQHEAPPLEAKALLDEAFARAAKEEKRVLLTFGAPWCGWCHRFEDWMVRPEVAAILGKDFIALAIDVERTRGGKEAMLSHRGAVEGSIPWFCFLDVAGAKLADSGLGDKNLGCPYSPEEIAAFGGLLKQVTRRITGEEIAALQASLAPKKEQPAGAGE